MPSIFRSSPRKDKHLTNGHPKSFSVTSREKAKNNTVPTPANSRPTSRPRMNEATEFGGLPHIQTPHTVFNDPNSPLSPPPILPPKYMFAPTSLPTITAANSIDSFAYSQDEMTKARHYGFLGGIGGKVRLSLEEVGRVIKVVGKELERRCLETPLLFSNQALELSSTRVRALIQSYIDSIRSSSTPRRDAWARELTFVRDHDLAWMLRWALSRIVRIREGTGEVSHGLIEWETYEEWRGRERAANYPHDAFPYLSALVPVEVYHIIISPLLSLLSRFAAHSHLSGLTPHGLSSLFAPFLFDIPTASPSMVAHAAFVRAAYATEHLLLSYIRFSGQGEGLGVTNLPGRLRDWVSGYPSMVASDAELARGQPRRGARTVRCERVSRIVRAYSRDLIASAETWAKDVDTWEAWDRVVIKSRRGEAGRPKFSNAWKRRIAVKDHLAMPGSPSSDGQVVYGKARRPTVTSDRGKKATSEDGEEILWGSLAGKEWSLFEEGGFDSPILKNGKKDDMKTRLQFDLNESAKMSVSERRRTMEWTEFAAPSGGFTRTDPVLDVSLSFASPLSSSIQEWPKERDDLNKRLHKSQKEATPFHHDTTPRVGTDVQDSNVRSDQYGRVYVEEAFVDWWADWAIGGAWTDRDELTFKEANWAIIEYKARPSRIEEISGQDPLADPRTTDLYFIFEEKVPLEYQIAVADPKEKKTFATLFNSRKKRGVNGTITRGQVNSGWEDSDFDRMLLHREKTKKVTLSKHDSPQATIWQMSQEPKSPLRTTAVVTAQARQPMRSISRKNSGGVEGEKTNFFSKGKDRVRKGRTDDNGRRANGASQRAHEVDFELHSASGLSSPDHSPREGARGDEKWMDILIANGARRMDRQDAPPPRARPGGPSVTPVQGGLPASPHPAVRQAAPSPTPNDHPAPSRAEIDPYAPYNSPAPADFGITHSPETSGSDAEAILTPREKGEVQRWPSNKRKPVPPLEPSDELVEELHDSSDGQHTHDHLDNAGSYNRHEGGQAHHDAPYSDSDRFSYASGRSEGPIPPVKDRPVLGEVISPRPQRDTIHNIVDTYRDSILTTSSDLDDSELSFRHEGEMEYTTRFKDDSHVMIPTKHALGSRGTEEVLNDRKEVEEKDQEHDLELPKLGGPVFDLTPGRKPSPARYKHGEPLQFVGEEPEEEEY